MTTGIVTFLFTDIEGSTALLAHLGDAAYSELLEDHHRIIRSSLQTFGILAGHDRSAVVSIRLGLTHSTTVGDMAASSSAFANLIWGFGQLGFDEDAGVIAGATFAGFFQMVYVDPPVTAMMEAVRRRMGESRYDQAYARGAAMGHEEAVAFALDSCDRVLALEEPAASGGVA